MTEPLATDALSAPSVPTADAPQLDELFVAIAQDEAERERERTLPFEAVALIRRARLGALRIPRADGGGGSTVQELFAVVIRLAEADANVAHILRNHFGVVERFVRAPQDDQHHGQQRRWHHDVLRGALIGLASTELGGTVVGNGGFTTTLTPEGDGYRLNGTKYYSTGTLYADYVLVRATVDGGTLAATIIPTRREGVELVDDWDGMGQRLTGSGTTQFRDVRVEAAEVVFDTPATGYGVAYQNTFAQLYLTAVNAGILAAILRDATALVRRRGRSFYYAPAERPADDPLLQQVVGEISCGAFAARSVVLAAAAALDEANARDEGAFDAPMRAALLAAQAKVVVDGLTVRAGGLLFDVGGASATSRADNLDRHWRNARTLASHNPAAYKARAIGDHAINGTLLPAKGFF